MGRKASSAPIHSGGNTPTPNSKCSDEKVAFCFQMVHQSSAEVYKRKKELVSLYKSSPEECSRCIAGVVLLVLRQTPQLPNDVLKRHYSFLESVAKACLEEAPLSNTEGVVFVRDRVAIDTIGCVIDFHNANEKAVRLGVVTTIEVLLKAVDQENTTDERQDLYQKVAESLKYRVHDRCPQVRERAVAAVAAFQVGKRDCDVTQQLMALLCTDSSADVRRQILRCIVAKKEFLEGYFHGMIRCINDTVARVRAEAWDALGRFPWRYITAYASAKNVHIMLQLSHGLRDSNTSVAIACKNAITSSWLQRDCKGLSESFLEPIIGGYAFDSLEPYELVSEVLFKSIRHLHPKKTFQLNLEDVNTSSLLMWKMECKAASERVDDDPEAEGTGYLISLETFSYLFQDVLNCYTRPDAPMKVAKFRSSDDADNMLRIILSIFDIYQEDGYLAHADNTTRHSLLKSIGFLLKVVPDDDPSLFVDASIRALKSLSARTPEEATSTVTSALDSLFRSLKLPQRYALGFEDVEAFGRKSRERQQELIKNGILYNSGRISAEEYSELKSEVDRDVKFLLRIQNIVWSYLSNSQRGDEIPTFCTHVIQLGRHSNSEVVQTIAVRSLGLQCLIRPEAVHTFIPLIVSDAGLNSREDDESLPVAAIGVIVDLIMEYGLGFFRAHLGQNKHMPTPDADSGHSKEVQSRLLQEQILAASDDHRVGSQNMLHIFFSFLNPSCRVVSSVAIIGSCKLLSANRLPRDKVPFVISFLLLHMAQFQLEMRDNPRSSYMVALLQKFFRSYASSHPRRQTDFVLGGVGATKYLLQCNACDTIILKHLSFLLRTGDAFLLSHIREIDPEVALKVREQEVALDTESESGDRKSSVRSSSNLSLRSSTTRSSMQSGRLLRELSRHSQHERIAEFLLFFICDESLSVKGRLACTEMLEKHLYFYSKDPQPFLYFLSASTTKTHMGDQIKQRIEIWVNEFLSRFHSSQTAFGPEDEFCLNRLTTMREDLDACSRNLNRYGATGFQFLDSKKPRDSSSFNLQGRNQVKVESGDEPVGIKRSRDTDDFVDPFNISAILGRNNKKIRQ